MSDVDDVMQALAAGIARRTVLKGPQGQRRSSRCHAIFTVNLMQRSLVADGRRAPPSGRATSRQASSLHVLPADVLPSILQVMMPDDGVEP